MKLQKLLYFAQRESFIQNNCPLLGALFYVWRYSPVLKEVRDAYKKGCLGNNIPTELENRIAPIVDYIFNSLADRDAWSLSRLSHGDIS